jgi:RNA polymerase sigma-70 factor (ECF subfamily)
MDAKLDELTLLSLLRQRDETAFTQLVEQYHSSLIRLATIYVQDTTAAEEVAQETWIAVLHGLDRFEGRSSLKTWIFTILTNKAKTRGGRENRTISYTDLEDKPTVSPDRFNDPSAEKWPDHWRRGSAPASWDEIPEDLLLSQETLNILQEAINQLPETQRLVMTLHDMKELSAQEICNILGLSETNQRVLLHRARAKVRQALEDYLQAEH